MDPALYARHLKQRIVLRTGALFLGNKSAYRDVSSEYFMSTSNLGEFVEASFSFHALYLCLVMLLLQEV